MGSLQTPASDCQWQFRATAWHHSRIDVFQIGRSALFARTVSGYGATAGGRSLLAVGKELPLEWIEIIILIRGSILQLRYTLFQLGKSVVNRHQPPSDSEFFLPGEPEVESDRASSA